MDEVIGGRFKVTDTLCGGRAYKAFDTDGRRQVFLKRWEPGDASFEDETAILKALDSPHAPELICTFEDETGRYLAEEWLEGETVEALVAAGGPLEPAEAAELLTGVCEALSFLHWNRQGAIVFIDLKPSNIIIRHSRGNAGNRVGGEIFLVDYEAARRAEPVLPDPRDPGSETRDVGERTFRLGSRYFTAPEVLFGKLCTQSDIYALGVLMGYLLTGREGFPGSYAFKGFPGEFIATCTLPDPEARYKGVSGVAETLREFIRLSAEAGVRDDAGGRRRRRGRSRGAAADDKRGAEGTESVDASVEGSGSGDPAAQGSKAEIPELLKHFRRSCVMVEGNPCFVSELSGVAAFSLKLRTAVFSLSERGRRSLEYYFDGNGKEEPLVADKNVYPFVFDHKSLYLHDVSEWVKRGLVKVTENGGAELYRGAFKLCLELPLRREEDVRRFVDWCFANFDLTVINVDRGDDRRLVNAALENCNYVVATPGSNVEDMESFRNYYLALAENGRLVYSKVRFVAWDYSEQEVPRERLFPVVGRDKYLGEVRRSEQRTKRRNRVDGANTLLPECGGQYEEILERLIS